MEKAASILKPIRRLDVPRRHGPLKRSGQILRLHIQSQIILPFVVLLRQCLIKIVVRSVRGFVFAYRLDHQRIDGVAGAVTGNDLPRYKLPINQRFQARIEGVLVDVAFLVHYIQQVCRRIISESAPAHGQLAQRGLMLYACLLGHLAHGFSDARG